MTSSAPVQVAIVGCGRMGRHHAELLAADRRAGLAAVFDPLPAAAESLCRDFAPQARACGSLEELWQCDGIDAVVICTPTRDHFVQARTALDRGWHILCEKPLASTAEEIETLISLAAVARERGRQFSVGYQRRHWATFRTLRREVQSGEWGRVIAIHGHCVERWQPTISGTWRDDPLQNPGGFLGDAGSHKLDLLFYIANLPAREVFARSWNRGSRVEIVTSLSAVFGNDVPVTVDFVGAAQHLGEDWHFHCETADLWLAHNDLWIARNNHLERLDATEPQSEPALSFLDAICHGAAELAPPECARPVFHLTQAILKSSRAGRIVTLD